MIGIDGQYIFFFEVGPYKDFIKEKDLGNFKLIEEVGNILPMFQLCFTAYDENILKYLNEGNILKVSFGLDKNGMTESRLQITKVDHAKVGAHAIQIAVYGLYDAVSYLTDRKISVTAKMNSISGIKNFASKYFSVDSGDLSPSDNMQWVQHNVTDKVAVSKIWMHSYIPSSFMALGITVDGTMRLRDVKKIATKSWKWKFTNKKVEEKDIPFDNYALDSKTGLVNAMGGYGRRKLVNRLEEGDFLDLTEQPQDPVFAQSADLHRASSIPVRPEDTSVTSVDNMHENFHKAFMQNVINLTTFSSFRIKLGFSNMFRKINVLDPVYFKEEIPNAPQQSSEYLTGLWVVSKISYVLEVQRFVTFVEIVREGLNSIKGSLD